MYVEQAFFQRWWRQQNDATRQLTQRLVANRQLEFVNGGWCMHDEASTYYVDMIDQTTLGHKFITLEFGPEALPTIGWQIGQRRRQQPQ
jgi:alpha-mannosidase